MNKQKSVLLVIDAQNDFHDIPGAALAVAGAVKDTERIAAFIDNVNPSTIFSSLDSHYGLDIAHPGWWSDHKGDPIGPFTPISADDIKNGKYVPRVDPTRSLRYVEALEANGEFKHFIWPEHCLIGTEGQALHPVYFKAIRQWQIENIKWVNFINKGTNPYTEHFGIFRANVPLNEDPSTQVNQGVFQVLNLHDVVYLAGQARTHCVANSLKQMLQIAPQLASKIVVLEDCMSNVPGLPGDFYDYVDGIYADAIKQGVTTLKSTAV
jgi:nicotinamidase-related amidase